MTGLDRSALDAMQERADAATFVGGDMQVLAEDVLDLLDEVRRLSDALAEAEQDRDAFSRISKRAIARAERAEKERDTLARWKAEALPVVSAFLDLARRVVPDPTPGRFWPEMLAEHIDRQAAALAEVRALADEYERDEREHLDRFGQHHPVAYDAGRHLTPILDRRQGGEA